MNYFPEEVSLGFQEIPEEISLIIPLAGCGHKCVNCHSSHYQNKDNGVILLYAQLEDLLIRYKNKATCVCVFGGEHSIEDLYNILFTCKFYGYKTALYSGYEFSELEDIVGLNILEELNYLKTGSYIENLGGLNSKTTNQKLFKVSEKTFTNITKQFWRNND